MSLSSICIKRPVLTVVMTIGIALFGIIGFTFLSVREYPNIDPSIISVSTTYTGANTEVIETQITEPIEEAIGSVQGIRSINSISRSGRSSISIEFELGVDLETAANDVRDKVADAIDALPADADPPVVTKADADASPIIVLNVNSNTRDMLELTEFADNEIKERLQTIPGISEIRLFGEKRYAMRLWMDPIKLAAYSISPLDIRAALLAQNIELPAGSVEGDSVELSVRTHSRLETVEEFNDLIIREENGNLVRMRDIGNAELGPENPKSISKGLNGPRVAAAIIPQPGSNQIAIANEFYKRLDQIRKDEPEDIELTIGFDTTRYISTAISEVKETIFTAFALVTLIIFLFLRDWRTTLIPVFAIPISLIGSFFIMYLAGFSINILTLLGLVLAIGMVVDDAIVVLEVIYSRIEKGADPIEAGMQGSREVFFAIISTTLALIVVFMPIIFLQGFTGRLFKEFGIVIGSAVGISAFVSLTLTPMMSARLIKAREKHNRFYERTEIFFVRLNGIYRNSLSAFLNHRWISFAIISLSAAMAVFFLRFLPQELAPMEDRSRLRVSSTAPEGTSFEAMEKYMDTLLEKLRDNIPEVETIIANTATGGRTGGANSGNTTITLVPRKDRKRSQEQIADALAPVVRKLNDARTFVSQEQTIAAGGGGPARFGLPIQFIIQSASLSKLKDAVPKFFNKALENQAFSAVDVNLKFNSPEILINIDRERARMLGVSVSDISQTLQLSLAGQRYDYFIRNGKQYQIIGQLARENRDEPVDLSSIFVRNNAGKLIQMSNLIEISEQSNPPQLYRYNRFLAATISAGLAPGYTLGDGLAAMREISKNVLDDTYHTEPAGALRDFIESSSSLLFVFLLSLLLTYLVLAAQFESYRDPIIIMLTVPLAIAGALLSLWYFNQTINIFSQIGQVMLVGLVTKNGILIVEFANQRKASGLSIREAVESAAAARFRPILMTSLSTILGILPVALGLGAGSESRVSMGIAVVGGLLFSGGLTLFVIPAMYTYLSKAKADC
jgi:multidrug efflux pump